MIANQWYAILESNEVRKGKPIGVTRMGEKSSRGGIPEARSPSCLTSVPIAVCTQRRCAERGLHPCPFHGFEFDTSGACTLVPANGRNTEPPKAMKVHTYPTREAHGFIYLWWGAPRSPSRNCPSSRVSVRRWFTAASAITGQLITQPAIENQLDSVHVPFVHYNTIGRGNKTVVNGPLCQAESPPRGKICWISGSPTKWTGDRRPKKASQIPEPNRRPSLQFCFPNLWHNWISDNIRAMIAFAPIDDENTLMYVRFYHKMRTPIPRISSTSLAARATNISSSRTGAWSSPSSQSAPT